MNYSEKWGKDVDSAIELALQDLKLSIEEVEVTVLEEPTKGFLGIGSKLAKVRVTKKELVSDVEDGNKSSDSLAGGFKETKTEDSEIFDYGVKDLRSSSKKNKTENKSNTNKKNNKSRHQENNISDAIEIKQIKSIIANRPEDLEDVTEHEAIDFLKATIEKMGLDLEITAKGNKDSLYIDIDGKEAGTIIGKRGQTLDAIQYLTSLVVNKDREDYIRVVVDAENYRAKREKTLQQLATRLCNKVIKTGRNVVLEPMNPYERMVIHATLAGVEGIHTRSEGDEPFRKVIIEKH